MKKKYINHKNIYFAEQARRELLLWFLAALVGVLTFQFLEEGFQGLRRLYFGYY